MAFEIVQLPSDVSDLQTVDAYLFLYRRICQRDPSNLDQQLAWARDGHRSLFFELHIDGQRAVGAELARVPHPYTEREPGSTVLVRKIATASEYQHRSLAGVLVAHLETHAATIPDVTSICALPVNAYSQKLFADCGFAPCIDGPRDMDYVYKELPLSA